MKKNVNKIIIESARNKKPYVVVKSTNNKILSTSETYERRAGAENLVKALKKALKNPVVIDKTKKKKYLIPVIWKDECNQPNNKAGASPL